MSLFLLNQWWELSYYMTFLTKARRKSVYMSLFLLNQWWELSYYMTFLTKARRKRESKNTKQETRNKTV